MRREKVDFERLNTKMDELESGLDKQTKELLHEARHKYMAALTKGTLIAQCRADLKEMSDDLESLFDRRIRHETR